MLVNPELPSKLNPMVETVPPTQDGFQEQKGSTGLSYQEKTPAEYREPKKPYFVQAPVKALEEDGINVGVVGTICFAIGVVWLTFQYQSLKESNTLWYLWTAITGLILGVCFTVWTFLRKRRRIRQGEISPD